MITATLQQALVQITEEELAAKAAGRDGYLEAVEPMLVRRDGKLFIDAKHPGYKPFRRRFKVERPATPKPRKLYGRVRPGDLVAGVLKQLGVVKVSCARCQQKQREMNALGWWGCWKRRAELVQWFVDQARRFGITVESETAWGLLKAGLRHASEHKEAAPPAATPSDPPATIPPYHPIRLPRFLPPTSRTTPSGHNAPERFP